MYPDEAKDGSPVKGGANGFIASIAPRDSKALVIDAGSLGSATALAAGGMDRCNIFVLNQDPMVTATAELKGFRPATGHSSVVLQRLVDAGESGFGIVYLDYCGTPCAKAGGWDPAQDAALAKRLLLPHGVLVATFSKRGVRDILSATNRFVPSDMKIIERYDYVETSAMHMVVAINDLEKSTKDKFRAFMPQGVPKRAFRRGTIKKNSRIRVDFNGVSYDAVVLRAKRAGGLVVQYDDRTVEDIIGRDAPRRVLSVCP